MKGKDADHGDGCDMTAGGGAEEDEMRTDDQGFEEVVAELLAGDDFGDPGDAPLASRSLAHLLTAASAPGRPAELAGEEAAVAAFRAALSPGDPSPQKAGRARFPLGRLLPVKIAAVALATATAAGGVALAAQVSGVTHMPFRPGPSSSSTPTDTPRPAPPQGQDVEAKRDGAKLVALCRDYRAEPPGKRPQLLDKPSMGALVTAAGGKARVGAYCTGLLGSSPPPGKAPEREGVGPGSNRDDRAKQSPPKGRTDNQGRDDDATGGASEGDDGGDGVEQDTPKSGGPGVGRPDGSEEGDEDDRPMSEETPPQPSPTPCPSPPATEPTTPEPAPDPTTGA